MALDDMATRITPLNRELETQVLQLKIDESQIRYHPSISSSIELSRQYDEAQSMAVIFDEEVCGFAMFGIDFETGKWKVFRLLIDKSFQGKGIGKRAMSQILAFLQIQKGADEVLLVVNSENHVAIHIYRTLGFVQYGSRDDKLLMKVSLR
ncbi:MAG: GNAT family N-acetyltransferase [Pseudomonadales bacterium]|nr:GNAT family N-acetyltransferase [Pseudomonadales bacterium]MBO6824534.1 GNAT family N-acetyltransferase [Pseudomonadales bacterium]